MDVSRFDFSKEPGKERTRWFSPAPKDALISVVTPYYNAGKYFEQTFNSVMNQTFPWFEWIIVNDGSTNQEDVEILHRLGSQDPRITIITQKNGGLSCARNTGIANSHTELIMPLDADDLIAPTYLEYLYWSLYYNPNAAWSYTSCYGFHDQEYIWKIPFNAKELKTNNFLCATALIRKQDIEDVGGYKVEKWPYYEDWRFWLEMLSLGKKPVHVASCLFWYRRLDKGMLSVISKSPEQIEFCKTIIENAAKGVPADVEALEYPVVKSAYPLHKSERLHWDREISGDHSKKRVLWMIPWMMMGGADKFNLDAIAGLREKGFDNYIISTQASENDWRQKFEDYTDEIFCLPDFLDPAHYMEFVGYYLQSRDIDIIMLTNSYDGYYMLPWIRQHFPDIVIVDYVHMEEWYWLAGGYARTSGAMAGILERTYVCNSSTRTVMIERFKRAPDTVKCLYIGVDEQYFDPDLVSEGYLHTLLNISMERPIILFPCRIHPQKRPFLMLRIAEEVRKSLPEAAFVVAGDGDQLNELKDAVQRKRLTQTVYFIGVTENMRACYKDSKLTLICSLKEGLALTAYESLSMGVPVVSSDVGGQRDLVGDDVGALIPLQQKEDQDFDKRDFTETEVQSYAAVILRILKDTGLYAQMRRNCRQKIEQNFTKDRMLQDLSRELNFLITHSEAAKQRHMAAAGLNQMPQLAADIYTSYRQWKDKEMECEVVWKVRCWYESLYKNGNPVTRRVYRVLKRVKSWVRNRK